MTFFILAAIAILCSPVASFAQAQDPKSSEKLEIAWDATTDVEPRAVQSWLYAIDDGRFDASGTLYRLGVTASGGAVGVDVVGETGVRDVFDIAFLGDRLFGIGLGTTFGISVDVLIEIDPQTGASTGVATIKGTGNFNALVGESSSTLLAATTLGEVWRINPDALTGTILGSYGSGFLSGGDLALTPSGTLYGTVTGSPSDFLASINRASGQATLRGAIGFAQVFGIATNPLDGVLLAVVDGLFAPKLVSLNQTHGAATVIGAIPVPAGITGIAAGPRPASECPSGFFPDPNFPDFCFRVKIGSTGSERNGSREQSCLPETICVSGAIPGRSEVFLRIVGPRPNGYLWPTIVRFTPSRVVVDIRQRSTADVQRYVLPAIPPGVEDLSGLQDRFGFQR